MSRALKSTSRLVAVMIGAGLVALVDWSHPITGPLVGQHVQAQVTCPNPTNPITIENCLTGTPDSVWDVPGGDSSTSTTKIQGFATDISVNRGDVVSFKIDVTPVGLYHLEIYRMGSYGGLGARLVTRIPAAGSFTGVPQPACTTDANTGLVDCGNWVQSAVWATPATATSGIYFAKAVRDDGSGIASHIFFIVRDDASTSNLVFQTSDTTWQAYNAYGDNSLYVGGPGVNPNRAYKVSYNRPFTTRTNANSRSFVFSAEYPMVRWLEANGYNVSYLTGVDSDRLGSGEAGAPPANAIISHGVFLSVGHDEYWSGTQRAHVEAARAAGTHLAFFSGNEVYWKTRWENSIDGFNTPHRTLVSYKETWQGMPIDPQDPPTWTGTWRDPRFSPPADGGRPENALTGTIWTVNCCTYTITVPAADGKMRFWRNTSVAALAPNTTATLSANTLGYEWDEDLDNGARPAGLVRMSTTTVNVPERLVDFGQNVAPGTATHHLTFYRHSSGALVFGAGTVQWTWGLDAAHDGAASTADVRMQQATVNLLADMGTQPGSLQPGLSGATASIDSTPPSSAITSPASGSTVQSDSPVTITGTASDLGGASPAGVVGGVEVSVDNGLTWHPANGRENWSYTWTPGPQGPTTIRSRAVDDSGNIETPGAGRSVIVGPPGTPSCPCTIWTSSTTPVNAAFNDSNAVEVGVRFRANQNGFITGLRFYKGSTNTGTHVGHLWTNSGTLLATATFTSESGSGWQQVTLSPSVAVTGNTTYVASYHTSVGRYAADPGYFATTGHDNPPLHALQDGVDGRNGVFKYDINGGGFPTDTSQSTNYWVDVVFNTSGGGGPDTTPPVISGTTATPGGAGGTGTATISWTTNEPSTSRVDYGTTSSSLTANVSNGALVTSHTITLTGLNANTTYYYRVTSADASGNSSTSPQPPAPPLSFTTPAASFTDTLVAHFNAGNTGANTYVSETADGEVMLTPTVGAEFYGSSLPAGWQSAPWTGGAATVSGGVMTVDGARAATVATYSSGRSLEFVATFSGEAFEHAGFVSDFSFSTPFAIVSTGAGGQLLARTHNGVAETVTPLDSSLIGSPHRYRIDWSATTAVFSVDGSPIPPHVFAIPGTMMPIVSNFANGGGVIIVNWVRLTPYVTSGTFISRVFDAGTTATWGNLLWTAETPAGTSIAMSAHPSTSATAATTCAGFTPVASSGGTIGGSSRYIQYCAQLSTTDPAQTPSLDDVTITFSAGAVNQAPVANNDGYSTMEDTPLNVPPPGVLANDTDADGNALTAILVSNPSHAASFTFNSDGSFSYTPALNFSGTDTFTYKANDGTADSNVATVTITVSLVLHPTSTSVSCSPATVPVNGSTTCTATVTDTTGVVASTPTGAVTFGSSGTGTFSSSSCTLSGSGSSASCSVTYTPTAVGTGIHTITTSYGGDTQHSASSGSTAVTVTARTTATSVSCVPASVPVNGSTTCTATVTDTAGGAGATTPTGTVTFATDSGIFSGSGSCTLNASGQCSVTYTPTVVGAHTIAASYSGDTVHTASSGTTVVTATVRSTSTGVSCSPSTVQVSQPTTCTATVTDTSGAGTVTPTGTVTFTTNAAGTFSSTICTLDVSGQCSVTYTAAAVGTHTITATYGGDASHTTSSGSTTVTVVAAAAAKVTGGGEIAVLNGDASFGFAVQRMTTGGDIKGNLNYYNHARKVKVDATLIRTFNVVGNTATFSGDCNKTVDGGPTTACTFSVAAQDNGEPGKNVDRFTIQVSGEPVEGTAPITKGNIQIH